MDEHPNKIPLLINNVDCRKHKVPIGIPCYNVSTVGGKVLPAVCNRRALRAGFTGEIHNRSLRGTNG